jgi:hypothetical protein
VGLFFFFFLLLLKTIFISYTHKDRWMEDVRGLDFNKLSEPTMVQNNFSPIRAYNLSKLFYSYGTAETEVWMPAGHLMLGQPVVDFLQLPS